MGVIKSEINMYLSAKRLIQAQIWKEEKCIKECTEDIDNHMKIDYVRLEIKLGRKNSFINERRMAIIRHKMNIERLKSGDIEFLFELILKEQKEKQKPLNSEIMKLIEQIENDIMNRQKSELYKPESMSMDEFIENGNQLNKKLKEYIWRFLEGDYELYEKLEQYRHKRDYVD